jgi:tetratricopeptide (TPR) repeat protein
MNFFSNVRTYSMNIVLSLVVLFLWTAPMLVAQTSQHISETQLLGTIPLSALRQGAFADWFEKGLNDYTPANDVMKRLAAPKIKSILAQMRVKIFFGSWCGDSKREVPRFLKIAQMLGWREEQLELIALDRSDSSYKRSPNGEERGFDIFRVPTFVMMQNGHEVERITEYASESLERDLLAIVQHQAYAPNYYSYALVRQWLQNGMLVDTNVSVNGLSAQLRHSTPVATEGELNSCAYVLLSRGQTREALTIFRINATLFPQSSACFESLSEGYERLGNKTLAIQYCERALELNSKNAPALKRLVKLQSLELK